jgi:hypothetical protein
VCAIRVAGNSVLVAASCESCSAVVSVMPGELKLRSVLSVDDYFLSLGVEFAVVERVLDVKRGRRFCILKW